jgi:hypothetical protein
VWLLCALAGMAGSPVATADSAAELRARYRELVTTVDSNPFHAPLTVSSREQGEVVSAEVYGVIDKPFAQVAKVIASPRGWCEFMLLSLHIKTCTQQGNGDDGKVTLYLGTKDYQTPDASYEITYVFAVTSDQEHVLVGLDAPTGPMGSKRNHIMVEAVPVNGHTILHFLSSIQLSGVSRIATSTYLATIGRSRIGFTTIMNEAGLPVPIKGVQGMIERNAMRYFLALQSHLEGQSVPEERRFEWRMDDWFERTERFHDQLYETPKEKYLVNKRRERANQMERQQRVDAAASDGAR